MNLIKKPIVKIPFLLLIAATTTLSLNAHEFDEDNSEHRAPRPLSFISGVIGGVVGGILGGGSHSRPSDNSSYGKYRHNIVHFADEHDPHDRLLTLDYGRMKLLKATPIQGSQNHHSDSMASTPSEAKYMMMVAKGSNFVTIRDTKNANFVKKIQLPFRPRSADAYNAKHNLVLLTSRDRPAAVLIDATKLEIVGKAGFNTTCNQPNIVAPYNNLYLNHEIPNLKCTTKDFGGDQISGHPAWISSEAFVILDRSNRLIHVYSIYQEEGRWKTKLEQTIKTTSSLHQVIPLSKNSGNQYFYGETEGNVAQNIKVGIYKWKLSSNGKGLIQQDYRDLVTNNGRKAFFNGHNLYVTPDKKFVYAPVGTAIKSDSSKPKRGGICVLRSRDLRFVKFIKTGYGAGHVNFSKQRGIAMVTNHKDNFVTAINYRRNRKIKDIPLKFRHQNIFGINQSHAPYIEPNGRYFYNFWTDGGVFFRINLRYLRVDRAVYVGGIPIQGNYYPTVKQ